MFSITTSIGYQIFIFFTDKGKEKGRRRHVVHPDRACLARTNIRYVSIIASEAQTISFKKKNIR